MADIIPLTPEQLKEQYDLDMNVLLQSLDTKRLSVHTYQKFFAIPKDQRPAVIVSIIDQLKDPKVKEQWDLYLEETPIQDMFQSMVTTAKATAGDVADTWTNKLPNMIKIIVDQSLEFINDQSGKVSDAVFDYLSTADIIPSDYQEKFKELYKDNPALAFPVLLLYLSFAVGGWVKSTVGAILLRTERQANKKYLNNIPDFHEFMLHSLWSTDTEKKVKDLMQEVGIPDTYYAEYQESAKKRFDPGEIFTLRWRGEIDEGRKQDYLKKAGYQDNELEDIEGLSYNIPGIQDLITMAVREAFRDDVSAQFGYDDEYPEDIEPWVEAQGYSGDWLKRYWRAHWTIPSVQQGFEMQHRQVITDNELETMLRVQDIPSFWRDKLLAISYNPYSRVDVRRLYKTGVLNEEQVYKNYRDLGYDHEHAVNLTKFTIIDSRIDEREASKAEVLNALVSNIITEREAKEYLLQLGYDDEGVELVISVELQKEQSRLNKRRVKVVQNKYVKGTMTEEKAREELTRIGIPPETIELTLQEWDIDIEGEKKIPTKADLAKFYKAGVIDKEKYTEYMIIHGYSPEHIEWYMKIISTGAEVE